MVTIKNELLKISIKLDGGSLTSIYDNVHNEELLYQMDKRSWMGQDVVIFPFIAALKNRQYKVNNITYSMKNHGLARYDLFKVKNKTNSSVVLEFNSNSNTLKQYPFLFHFEVYYELNQNKLTIEYRVLNTDSNTMYFSVGGHPALKASGYEYNNRFIFDSTKLEFDNDIKTTKFNLNDEGNLITSTQEFVIPKEFVMTKDLITKEKTLIYDAKNINKVILFTNEHKYTFDTSKAEILAIWTMKGFGNYICVEPWWGIPDYENPNEELKDKPMIHKLESNEEFRTSYSITIE